MRKLFSVCISLCVVGLLALSSVSCEKLKISNLKANSHFKKANKLYEEEKFRKAIDEYELALKLNPKLDKAAFYLGTSYAMVYKPGDTSSRNQLDGEKAKNQLLKALKLDPKRKEIILALGDIFDKMQNFDEAEKYYLLVQQNNPKDPKVYYVLADFYAKYGKNDRAMEMYENRISLNPSDPEGYQYFATFLQNRKMWDQSMENHNLRIQHIEQATGMDEKAKNALLTEAYYTLGVVAWNKSYQTPADQMSPGERLDVVQKGFDALTKASELDKAFADPWAYMNLLWREKAKAEPLKEKEYLAKAEECSQKFVQLRRHQQASEEFMKSLEKMEK